MGEGQKMSAASSWCGLSCMDSGSNGWIGRWDLVMKRANMGSSWSTHSKQVFRVNIGVGEALSLDYNHLSLQQPWGLYCCAIGHSSPHHT